MQKRTHTDWLGADYIDTAIRFEVRRLDSPTDTWKGRAYYGGSWHDIDSHDYDFTWEGECVMSIESYDYYPLTGQSGAVICEWTSVAWNWGEGAFNPNRCSGSLSGVEEHLQHAGDGSWYADVEW